jgi:hypothetical protein
MELTELERCPDELVAAGVFEDERPLKGLAGLVDWRLCGRLSALYLGGFASGALGERVLRPTGGRLPQPAVLLMGLGPRGALGLERAAQVARATWEVAVGLGARSISCEIFGAAALAEPPERKVRALLATLGEVSGLERVTVLADAELHPMIAQWRAAR